jgi:hypothetical protein
MNPLSGAMAWLLASPSSQVQDRLDATRVDEGVLLVAPSELSEGRIELRLATLGLEYGRASVIASPDQTPLGLVFEGEGWLELHPTDPGQELALRQDLSLFGSEEFERLSMRRLVLLSAESPTLAPTRLDEAPLADTFRELPAAWIPRDSAQVIQSAAAQVALELGLDASGVAVSGPPTLLAFAEVELPGGAVGVLTLIRDPQHLLGQQDELVAWAWTPSEQDPTLSLSGTGAGPEVVHAELDVRVQPAALELELDVKASLLVEGGQEASQALFFSVPSGLAAGGFELRSVSVGRREVWVERSGSDELLVVLRQPLEAGEQVEVELHYGARVRFDGALPEGVRRGPATGLIAPLPQLSTRTMTARASYRLRVGVPLDSELQALLSTASTASWSDGEHLWVEGRSEPAAERPMLALGSWTTSELKPSGAVPALQDHSWSRADHSASLEQARQALEALAAVLGPVPWERVQIYEGPITVDSVFWQAGEHLVQRGSPFASRATMAELLARSPRWPASFTFHELAHAWFGHQVAAADAQAHCAIEALAEVSACLAMDRVHPGACQEQQLAWRGVLSEGSNRLSATQSVGTADRIRRCYVHAPHALLSTLSVEAGPEALERLPAELVRRHAGGRLGWSDVLAALEDLSGVSLDPSFRFWLEAGHLPGVQLRTVWDRGAVTLDLEADIPGRFMVPVRVGERLHRIEVDRIGSMSVPAEGLPSVELDPGDRLALRGRAPAPREDLGLAGGWRVRGGAELRGGWIEGPADSAASVGLAGGDWSNGEILRLVLEAERSVVVEVQVHSGRGSWAWRKVELVEGINELELPLSGFRWGGQRPPRWDHIEALQIWLREPARLRLGELELQRGAGSASPDLHDLAGLLEGAPRAVRSARVQLLTDDPQLDLVALEELAERVREVLASRWPSLTSGPPPLLVVSSSRGAWLGLLQGFAASLNAQLEEPSTGGLTLQDVATSFSQGSAPRPVFAHELTHALVARSGVLPEAPGSCLHEGLASWVQLRLYPQPELDEQVRTWGEQASTRAELLALLEGGPTSAQDRSYALCATMVDLLGERGLPLNGLLSGRYAEPSMVESWADRVAVHGLPPVHETPQP